MANKSTVAGDLRRFATFVKGLTDAADVLDQMQSLEEAAIATEQCVTAATGQLTALQAQIADADRELVDTRAKAATSTRNAQAKAQSILDDADIKAANVIEVARQTAQNQAAALVTEAQVRRDALQEQVIAMGDQLLRMSEDRDRLAAAIEASSADLADVEGKLAAAREAVAKLLG